MELVSREQSYTVTVSTHASSAEKSSEASHTSSTGQNKNTNSNSRISEPNLKLPVREEKLGTRTLSCSNRYPEHQLLLDDRSRRYLTYGHKFLFHPNSSQNIVPKQMAALHPRIRQQQQPHQPLALTLFGDGFGHGSQCYAGVQVSHREREDTDYYLRTEQCPIEGGIRVIRLSQV